MESSSSDLAVEAARGVDVGVREGVLRRLQVLLDEELALLRVDGGVMTTGRHEVAARRDRRRRRRRDRGRRRRRDRGRGRRVFGHRHEHVDDRGRDRREDEGLFRRRPSCPVDRRESRRSDLRRRRGVGVQRHAARTRRERDGRDESEHERAMHPVHPVDPFASVGRDANPPVRESAATDHGPDGADETRPEERPTTEPPQPSFAACPAVSKKTAHTLPRTTTSACRNPVGPAARQGPATSS